MNTQAPTLAARFFFRNCAVSLHLPGEMRISRTLTPGPDDVILDRDFTPACSPIEFIGSQSDFYRFLNATSLSNFSILKKLSAIGYVLCNKIRRDPRYYHAFMCVNEDKLGCCNGKTLFSKAIAQYCNAVFLHNPNPEDPFWLSDVTEQTNLLIVDDLSAKTDIRCLYHICPNDWVIHRKCYSPLIIDRDNTPSVIVSVNTSIDNFQPEAAFRRRFVLLEFSSFFGANNPILEYIGRFMFDDWDVAQWHMFDNLMLYCALEYLRSYAKGIDLLRFYA